MNPEVSFSRPGREPKEEEEPRLLVSKSLLIGPMVEFRGGKEHSPPEKPALTGEKKISSKPTPVSHKEIVPSEPLPTHVDARQMSLRQMDAKGKAGSKRDDTDTSDKQHTLPVHTVDQSHQEEGERDSNPNNGQDDPTVPLEVDFYYEPTILSRLVLNQKYGRAIGRVHEYPHESRIWVCAKRKSHDDSVVQYTIRQLPIHIAVSNLVRTHDSKLRTLLNELIGTLIYANPQGAHEVDHRDRLPLFEAVWYGAAPDAIRLFLMAQPEAILLRDKMGRSLKDLNQHRPPGGDTNRVNELLGREVTFWKRAREQARIRLKERALKVPFASNRVKEEATKIPTFGSDLIPPLSWQQLENRAIVTEQYLTEVNERNYELSQTVQSLTKLDEVQGNRLVKELDRLSQENASLARQLNGVESFLSKHAVGGDPTYRLALAEVSSLAGLSDTSTFTDGEPVLPITKEAQAKRKELSKTLAEQRRKLHKIRHVIKELTTNDGDSSSSGSVSGLTSSHSDHSRSDFARIKQSPASAVVDRVPQSPKHARRKKVVDSLSVIFRYATTRGALNGRERKESDNLSTMIRWAASRDDGVNRDRTLQVGLSWSPPPPSTERSRPAHPTHRDVSLPAILPPSKDAGEGKRQ